MTQLPKIQFFEPGSTDKDIRTRIDQIFPGLLECVKYCSPIANGDCYKARLFDGRKLICIVKGE
jgi:hypothetical protein